MTEYEVLVCIVRAWKRRPDPSEPLTLNQIANIALGSGNSANAARVGRAAHSFKAYFRQVGSRKLVPIWDAIERDHPSILRARPTAVAPPPTDASPSRAYESMIDALRDEANTIRLELRRNPIHIAGFTRQPELEDGTSAIYAAQYFVQADDTDLPIPDGAPIRIHLGPIFFDGTLLSHDPDQLVAYLSFGSPLTDDAIRERGLLEPKVEELIKAVAQGVVAAGGKAAGVHQRLLEPALQPKRLGDWTPLPGSLDESQQAAVEQALQHDITFIWGPPGTGKTHALGELITSALHHNKRVLVIATANVAVDQVCLKLRDALDYHALDSFLTGGKVLRFGYARDTDVLQDRRFFPDREEARQVRTELREVRLALRRLDKSATADRVRLVDQEDKLKKRLREITTEHLSRASVVLTSAMQCCISGDLEQTRAFDMVVVDEASMMPIPLVMATTRRARSQIVIAGDFRQLGPIAVAQSEKALRWLHQDPFDLIRVSDSTQPDHPALAMLRCQRRMHPDISRCVNRAYYGGSLIDGAKESGLRAAGLPPLEGRGAALLTLNFGETGMSRSVLI
ncbi:MAG: hypothetical protein FJ148_25525 [Deltaproteobacteria bacterium]|nr:hypothetical protein [Deltaproteobacteria bacterium]